MPSDPPTEIVEELVGISSRQLRLEGVLSYPAGAAHAASAVLLCPPHPFLGGDMHCGVLRHARPELASRGHMALSFNYRGIGRSETDIDLAGPQKEFWERSTCPAYESRIYDDAEAAFRFLKEQAGEAPLAVIGYSFGCLPALDLAAKYSDRVRHAAIVSPPLGKWPLKEAWLGAPSRKAVFYSPGDFACPQDRLDAAYAAMAGPKTMRRFEGCGHFYIGREKELAAELATFLSWER